MGLFSFRKRAGESVYDVGSGSDVGMVREKNEDSIGFFQIKGTDWQLFLVCDGMGGHLGGQRASSLAVEIVSKNFAELVLQEEPLQALTQAMQRANAAICAEAESHADLRGMGTTCAALAIRGSNAYIAHAGDSRIYRIRPGSIQRLTRDHSNVQRMVDAGMLTAEAARTHPDNNVLYKCLGTNAVFTPDARGPIPVLLGDRFLLCSDGLHGLVEEPIIAAMALMYDPETAVGKLIALAKSRGGHDNVSVQIVHQREANRNTNKFDPEKIRVIPNDAPSTIPGQNPAAVHAEGRLRKLHTGWKIAAVLGALAVGVAGSALFWMHQKSRVELPDTVEESGRVPVAKGPAKLKVEPPPPIITPPISEPTPIATTLPSSSSVPRKATGPARNLKTKDALPERTVSPSPLPSPAPSGAPSAVPSVAPSAVPKPAASPAPARDAEGATK